MPLGNGLVVRFTDSHGDPISNALITFRVTAGEGGLWTLRPPLLEGQSIYAFGTDLGVLSDTSDDAGLAGVQWQLGSSADSQRVEASIEIPAPRIASSRVTFQATASPGYPARVMPIGGNSQAGQVGRVLPAALAALVVDKFGTPIPGEWVTWANDRAVKKSQLGGTLAPASTYADKSGVARFDWTLGTTPGEDSVRVGTGFCHCGSLSISDRSVWFTSTVLP